MVCKREVHYKGVSKTVSGRYSAEITWKKNNIRLGTFGTAEEAALAYDNAARSLRGSRTTTTNFPAPSVDDGSSHGGVVAPNDTVGATCWIYYYGIVSCKCTYVSFILNCYVHIFSINLAILSLFFVHYVENSKNGL